MTNLLYVSLVPTFACAVKFDFQCVRFVWYGGTRVQRSDSALVNG